MPKLRTYHGFISHAWKYGDQYDRLVSLLRAAPNFLFVNWSAPDDKPVIPPGTWAPTREIENAIKKKIRMAQIVLVIGGMYAAHSSWMQKEIDIARRLEKPMIGIKPRGNTRMPSQVLIATLEDVGWDTSSIVGAIRRNALHAK